MMLYNWLVINIVSSPVRSNEFFFVLYDCCINNNNKLRLFATNCCRVRYLSLPHFAVFGIAMPFAFIQTLQLRPKTMYVIPLLLAVNGEIIHI